MGWADRRSKNGIVDGIAKNQNKIKGEEHMNDLIERLRLGDGTSADHELLLEAADALEALAQPEQEPVAFLCHGNLFMWPSEDDYCGNPEDHIPLYTTPPQRTWAGLTAGEILDTLISVDEKTVILPSMLGQFACAIEAQLKDKNT